MPLQWDVAGDFGGVVDAIESVTLYRGKCRDTAVATRGWRFEEVAIDPSDVQGSVRRIDVLWHLPVEPGATPPSPGDTIVDERGVCFGVRSVTRLRAATRYVCETRTTVLADSLSERFDLERPIWEDGPEGPAVVGWRTVRPGVRGVVTVEDPLLNAGDPEPPKKVAVTLTEDVMPREDDRLRRRRGGIYLITAYTPPESIGDPYLIEAALAP